MKLVVAMVCLSLVGQSLAGGMFGNHTCGNKARKSRGGAGFGMTMWTNAKVPTYRDPSFTDIDYKVFTRSKDLIEKKTCIRFVPKTGNGDHLFLKRECACGSTADGCFEGGYTDGLGSWSPRYLVMSSACLDGNSNEDVTFMVHEIFHALGVEHTQTRPDRDNYVIVHEDNIKPRFRSQYDLCSQCKTYGTPYNCMSIMHYRDYFFQTDSDAKTMTAKVSSCNLQTYATEITDSDWALINAMYCNGGGGGGDEKPADECNGDTKDWNCCSKNEPCGVGGGDCDNDSDCSGGLVCGTDNCREFHPNAASSADCCKERVCDGTDWSCCSWSNQCGHGEGDCDYDYHCQDGLTCGNNNCRDFNPSAPKSSDCCV